jgi:hypothetical protein
MPRVQPQDVKPFDVYGKDIIDNSIIFRERLIHRFKAHETVQVKNIDDEPITWQFLPSYAETTTITDEGTRITTREEPEYWRLDPGETDVLTGDCAYHMIEKLYKQLIVKKVGVVEHPTSSKQIRNFNFKDPINAEKYIDLIYQGKVTPSFNQLQSNEVTVKKEEKNAKTQTVTEAVKI